MHVEKTEKDVLKGMAAFISYGESQLSEEEKIDEALKAEGINLEETVARLHVFCKTQIEGELVKARGDIHEDRLCVKEKIKSFSAALVGNTQAFTQGTKALWEARLGPRLANAFFRNLTDISVNDQKSLAEDLELLQKLEEISRTDKKP